MDNFQLVSQRVTNPALEQSFDGGFFLLGPVREMIQGLLESKQPGLQSFNALLHSLWY